MFAWDQIVKAGYQSPQHGREVIIETTPLTILKAPNRFRTESILHSICVSLAELIALQEAQAQRVAHYQRALVQPAPTAPEPQQLSLFGTDAVEMVPQTSQ